MNTISSFSTFGASLFNEKIFSAINTKQGKIFLVASLALASLAVALAFSCYCFNWKKTGTEDRKQDGLEDKEKKTLPTDKTKSGEIENGVIPSEKKETEDSSIKSKSIATKAGEIEAGVVPSEKKEAEDSSNKSESTATKVGEKEDSVIPSEEKEGEDSPSKSISEKTSQVLGNSSRFVKQIGSTCASKFKKTVEKMKSQKPTTNLEGK